MRSRWIVLAILIALPGMALCQQTQKASKTQKTAPAQAQLKNEDIDQFCKVFPDIEKELEELGAKTQGQPGEASLSQAFLASEEAKAILKKHGVDEVFMAKIAVISQAYSLIMLREASAEMNAQMAEALKAIEDNPNFTPEMKAQMKQQMQGSTGSMSQTEADLKAQLHPGDVALVERRKAEVKRVFEPEEPPNPK